MTPCKTVPSIGRDLGMCPYAVPGIITVADGLMAPHIPGGFRPVANRIPGSCRRHETVKRDEPLP